MSNVVDLPVITTLDLDPNRVLAKAIENGLKTVVVIGYRENGDEYFASSVADGGTVGWLMDRAKHKLMHMADDLSEQAG